MLVEWDAVDGCRSGSMLVSRPARHTTGAIQPSRHLPLFLDVHRDGSCVRELDVELRQRNAWRCPYKKRRGCGFLAARKKCDADVTSLIPFGDGHFPPASSAAVSNAVDGITIRKLSRRTASDNATSLIEDIISLSPRLNHHTLRG